MGGGVTSLDFRKQNIELGEFLASEHPDYKIKFVCGKAENFLANVAPDEFDLVLGLSVLHNISKQIGLKKVLDLVKELSQKVTAGIFEFALEGMHKSYIPEDYHDFLPGFSFIRDISFSSARGGKSAIRPLCFASDKYVYFESFGMLKIDSVDFNVHSHLAKTDVMYFNCGDKFIKFFNINPKSRSSGPQQIKANQEIQFLKEFGGQNGFPKLLDTLEESHKDGKRIFIIRERLEGVTLLKKLASGEEVDPWDVIKQALQWMVFLEERGYWHGDLGAHNFIYTEDGKIYPIDYEEIHQNWDTVAWPYRVSLRFLTFMNAVLKSRQNDTLVSASLQNLSPLKKHLSQKQYEQILELEESNHFFHDLYEILFGTSKKLNYTMADLEFLAITKRYNRKFKENDSEFKNIKLQEGEFSKRLDSLFKIVEEQQKRIEQLEKNILPSQSQI